MPDPAHSFHVADYAVFGSTIFISIGIGIFYALSGGRQRTTSEYLVGGRTMKFLPVAISLMVSYESSIMMLGLPAEMYVYGVQYWLSTVGFMCSQFLAIFIVVPLFFPLRLTSAYEYLEYRFKSRTVRLVGSLIGIINNVWYMGIVLFGPAIALEAVTGFSQWGSIFVVAVVAVIYTTIGGLKAVIWTDVFQATIMYSGMLAILIKGTIDVGGPAKVWEVARKGGRLDFLNFDFDPRTRHTVWNLLFGTIFRGMGLAYNQSTIQRISSTRTQKEAKWMMVMMAPCFFASLSMACYEGIVAFAYHQSRGCDPLASKEITDPNQVIPFTVMDIFQSLPGMPGLFLASLFSASLSTLSSGLSSISALLWTDFVKPVAGPMSERKATAIAKISVVVAGGLACAVALLVSTIGGPLTQISGSLLSAFGGPLTGIFILGCFCPGANAKGAILGSLVSLIIAGWIALGKNFAKNIRRTPFLAPASIENCLANHSLSLFNVTSSGGGYDVVETLLGAGSNFSEELSLTTYRMGLSEETGLFYATTTASDGGQASLVPELKGIEQVYTLSYMWLGPVSILGTVILGVLFSWITGGNKPGEVNPRHLLSLCDHLFCYLPESVRSVFRCGVDYADVQKEEDTFDRDVLTFKEIIISPPSDDENQAMTGTPHRPNGSDVTKDPDNGSDVSLSTLPGDGDVIEEGRKSV
ncbi:sodium-dependent multivitamin transporter-like [Babylonia areolata]|uniref:sodium-dependent multivitamin transporter-like n=1 Tax=Babylonia areolata TaxID=304850 RepID=UPI003FD04D96